MRKLLLLFFICSTSSLILAQGVPELMYYKFDGTGTTVNNLASTPVGTNPATLIGGQTQGPTGQFGNALIGTGGSSGTDYVDTGWPTSLTGDWTISFWTSNIAPSTTLYYIFGDNTASSLRCFTNGVAGAGNWVLRGTGITDVVVNGGATVAPHVMHYVYDNTVPEIRAYLDGVLVNTVAQTPIALTGTGPFKVGGYAGSTGLAQGGLMDEFRLYNRALTAAEVSATWNQSLPLVVGPKDLALNALISPSNANVGCYGASETVEVSLFNFGTDTVFFPTDNAQITVNATGVNPQNYQTTLNTGFLEPGGNTNVVMATNFNMSAGGTYTFDGYVEFLTGGPDANLANDTMATSNVTSNNAVVLPGQPWNEDFETFIVGNPGTLVNGWTRGTLAATNNWNVEDATGANENSTGTGPFYDNTNFGTPGGIYMFIETSGGVVGALYDLVSPCIDLSGVTGPTLEYSYHMFGPDMGYLVTQVFANGVWTTVDSLNGPQQTAGSDPWGTRSVSLGLYAGQVVQLRFIGQNATTGFTGDASIDDITIFEPAPNDLFHAGTTDPTSPACSFTATEPITIDIQNVGSATLNLTDIEATYTVTGPVNSGPVTEVLTGAGTLAPGATLSYTFTTTADLSTPGLYTVSSGVNFTAASGLVDPALAGNVDTISVQPGLAGTFTIDGSLPTGGINYQTFSEAAADLNTFGLCGPVVFNVQSGTYTDQMTLFQLIGSDATNTVTFDGGSNSPILTYDANAAEQATVLLSGADYIIFQNMTVENQKVSEGWGFLLTQSADHITIDNVTITLNPSATFDVAGVVASGSTINDITSGQNANYLTVQNCTITGGEKSITLEGQDPTLNYGHTIMNNVLTGADDFGIEMDDQDSVTVIGNQISGLRNTQSDGIWLFDVNNINVQANNVQARDWGMYIFDANDGNTPSQRSIVANNMVQSDTDYGTYLNDIESTDVFGNSFSGNVGIRVNDPVSVDIRGNIANGTNSFAIWLDDGAAGLDSLDYNLYNSSGDIANLGPLGNALDLVVLQGAIANQNLNSIQGNPDFVTATDLHIAGTLPNNVGDPSLGLLEDIDGDVRSLTTPDIGADEFTPLATDLGLVSFVLPISGCGLQAANQIIVEVRNFGTDTAFTFDLSYRLAGVTTTETFMDTLLPGATKAFTFTATADLSTVGATYIFDGWPTLLGDTNFGNDSIIGYSVEHFNAISVFPYIESFDNPGGSLPTGWIQQADDSGQDWLFDQNGTPTGGTGPTVDHTTGTSNGYYAYVEDTGNDNDSVTLITPCFDVSGLLSPKFSFWYHSNNSQGASGTQENEMHIDLIYNGTITYDFIPPIVHKDNNWNLIELNMAAYPGVFSFRFRVNNRNNNGSPHDIAIDDISVVDVLPQDVGVTALLDPIGGCGLLATDTVILEISNLGTDSIKGGFDVSFQLGTGPVTTISIPDTILAGNVIAVPFFPVDLSVPGTYNVTAWTSGLAGDTNLGNDTLQVDILSEASAPLPFAEDFESYGGGTTTFLDFVNDPNAQINWQVNSGGTGSTGTGPTAAFEGSNYIYMETSGPAAGSQAILRSNCIDLTSATNPALFYAYHAFGSTVGFLSVDVEANAGITNVANFIGQQQTANADPWKLDTVDLTPWLGQSIRLIFTGETNGSFTSDISLDAIDIRDLVDNDMGALSVLQPSGAECNSDSTIVEIEISNTGVLPQVNIPVTVDYSGAASGSITTIVPGPIAPGAIVNVVVGTINTNVGGMFNFSAYTGLSGDQVNANDTIFSATTITVSPAAPTAVMDTIILCTPDSTIASVVNDTANSYMWYSDPVGGIPFAIDTSDIQTSLLTSDTTFYVEAVTAGSGPLVKVTEAELQGPDYLELQNTGNTPVDVTGWTVAIGEDAASSINDVETVMWTMAGVMAPGEIRYRADNTAAGANYWGANILWNGGQEGWVVVLDANDIVVDVMFFNYTDADIMTFAPTINGTVIDITGQWSGPGIDVSSPVTAQNVYRTGTFDNNDATDWMTTATAAFAGQGTQNPGLGPVVTGGGGSGACPSERTPITILVAPDVPLDLGPDAVTCAGYIVDAFDSSIASYMWNTGEMTASITVDTSGVYYVDVVDMNGCTGTDTINLNILPSPTVDLGPDSVVSCGPFSLDAGNPGSTFVWNVPGQTAQVLPVTGTGSYYVTVDINGCTASDTIYAEVLPAPSLSLGGTISSCDDVTLDALNPGSSYLWSTGATSQMITVTPPAMGGDTITVVVTNAEGCDITEQVIITPGVDPVVDLGADITDCDSVLLDAGNPGASYAWSTGATSQTIYATTDGNYAVTVTDPTGCESTDDINVTLEFSPVASIGVNASFGYTYDFTNLSTTGASVVWKFGDGSANSTDPNPTHVYAFDGSYVVTLVVTNNCGTDSTTITLGSVDIDDLFSQSIDVFPNPTSGNFFIKSAELQADNLSIEVYDAKGSIVYRKQLGRINGVDEQVDLTNHPKGVYMIKISDGARNATKRVIRE